MRESFFLKANSFRWIVIILCGLVFSTLILVSLFRIRIDTNILTSLPKNDPVIADAHFTISHHPYQNQIVIDISCQKKDIDRLILGGELVEAELIKSGLFRTVGMQDMQHLFPKLLAHITNNLPVLFSAEELNAKLRPIMEGADLKQRIKDNLSQLLTMEGVGQTEAILNDPLGLRSIVLQKLKQLLPADNVHVYKGRLISSDRKHLLIMANPKSASIDSTLSHDIADVIERIRIKLNQKFEASGDRFTLTPFGAYRAALDNEMIAKKDIQISSLLASLGIALLLIFSFPRPLIGLLGFLPAVFGALCSLIVCSLWSQSISIMAIGFGGAIISFTGEYGMSYLLFLDRPYETKGWDVDKEVRSVGFLAALTTVGAFLALSMSGFPILSQIGQFAAFGVAFAFIFTHFFFPLIFPIMRPAKSKKLLPLQAIVNKLFSGGKYKFVLALGFVTLMSFYAMPEFKVDIDSMNTVRKETIDAENLFSSVWGHKIFDKIYMVVEADNAGRLQEKGDELASSIDREISSQRLSSAFLPSMIFPGTQRSKENLAAWNQFWNEKQKTAFSDELKDAAVELGLTADAFANIYAPPDDNALRPMTIPKEFYQLFNIYSPQKNKNLILFTFLASGPSYKAGKFFSQYHQDSSVHVFDPLFFSQRLGEFLSKAFMKMVIIIGVGTILISLIFFMDISLTLIAITPIFFAMACTLGTLHLIGHPLNIASLVLAAVVIGMGSDYALYLVCGYQRYRSEFHPRQDQIRMTIFLAATSTLIGFGSLSFGDHNLMKNLGLFLVLGIGFSLIGTFALLPPVLNHIFKPVKLAEVDILPNSTAHLKRIRLFYRHLEAYPRLFARFKILFDPMFKELGLYLNRPNILIDIGCGFGVPAAWIRAVYPDVTIYGIEPDLERVRIASRVVGANSNIDHGRAPDLPDFAGNADTALMLDMIHYLNDADLTSTFANLLLKLSPSGRLIMRVTVPFKEKISFYRRLEKFRLTLFAIAHYYRSLSEIEHLLTATGFIIKIIAPSGNGREEIWIVAEANGNPV